MTSVAVTLSVDSRGPTGLYIISDSRITWGTADSRWDNGQKTFASARTPDIFGFCGDAYFPAAMLRQITDQISVGLLFDDNADSTARHLVVKTALEAGLASLARVQPQPFSVLHGVRENCGMKSRFRLFQTKFSSTAGWEDSELNLDVSHSYLAHVDGSGRGVIETRRGDWVNTNASGTSRAAIWSFCDALQSGKDSFSGGPPQLVGIWRNGPAQTFGFLWHGKRYFSGTEIAASADFAAVKWFNHLFERCDGKSGKRIPKAQRQQKPPRASVR